MYGIQEYACHLSRLKCKLVPELYKLTFKRVLVYIIFEKLGCMQRGPDLVESSGLASSDQDLVLHQIQVPLKTYSIIISLLI